MDIHTQQVPVQQVPVQVQMQPMVAYTYQRTNHAKHIFWSFMTIGLWAMTGYPICVLLNRRARTRTVIR